MRGGYCKKYIRRKTGVYKYVEDKGFKEKGKGNF
jgi:hypothetical protein